MPDTAVTISSTEAAARLGVSVRTLDRMEHDGRLRPLSRIGGRRKYDAAQVAALLRGGDGVPSTQPAKRS